MINDWYTRFLVNEIIALYYDGEITADQMALMVAYHINFERI